MKQRNTIKESFPLTSAGIDAASARLAVVLKIIAGQREGLRIRLAVEEVLSHWQNTLGEDAVCTLWCGSRFGQRMTRLSAAGTSADPSLSRTEDDLDAAGNIILEKLGLAPSYRYVKGVNQVTFSLPAKKPNQLVWIGFAVVLSILLGFVSLSLSAGTRALFSDGLATPILGMLLGALSGVAMPMIFFSICTSIMNIGDITTLGRIGKKFLTWFLGLTFAVSALTIVLVAWLFPISTRGSNGAGDFQAVFSMLLAIVPGNLISPFIDGNLLQIIFLGGCFGVVFLMMGERVRLVADVVKQLDQVISMLMEGIDKIIPFFVFLTFYTLTASGAISRFGGTLRLIVLVVVLLLLMMILFTVALCLYMRLPLHILIPKLMPPFLVALSTASSMASYPIRLETCKRKLGIDERAAHFCVPLAQAIFKPSACVLYCCAALCIASEYHVPITLNWLIFCIVLSGILAVASPPVAGGAKIAYAALFAQLGIPAEGLVLAMAAESVLDFLMTASNVWVQMVLNVLCGNHLGLVNHDVLFSAD